MVNHNSENPLPNPDKDPDKKKQEKKLEKKRTKALESHSLDSLPKRKRVAGEDPKIINRHDGFPINPEALAAMIDLISVDDLHDYYSMSIRYLMEQFIKWQRKVDAADDYLTDVANEDVDLDEALVKDAMVGDSLEFVDYLLTLPDFLRFREINHWELGTEYVEILLRMMLNYEVFPGTELEILLSAEQAEMLDEMFQTSLVMQMAESMKKKRTFSAISHVAEIQVTNADGQVVQVIKVKISARPDIAPEYPDHVFVSSALDELAAGQKLEITGIFTDSMSLGQPPKNPRK